MGLSETIESLAFFTAIRESAWVYPILLATHLSGIAIFGGAVFMRKLPDLRAFKFTGLTLMIVTGALLAGAKATQYATNPYFQLKLVLLALLAAKAIFFRNGKLAAYISLALWLGVISAGRLIAYYEPP